MNAYINLMAAVLFIGAAAVFASRIRLAPTPVKPYLVAIASGILGCWAGHNGAFYPAIIIYAATGFLIVHLTSEPYPEETDEDIAADGVPESR